LEQLVYGHISAENRENQSRNWEIRNESMSDAIISVEGLGKKYRISHQGERQRYVALRDVIAEKAKSVVQKLKSLKAEKLKPENISGFQDFSVSEFKKDVSGRSRTSPSTSSRARSWASSDATARASRPCSRSEPHHRADRGPREHSRARGEPARGGHRLPSRADRAREHLTSTARSSA
jgi:hypothetical protein